MCVALKPAGLSANNGISYYGIFRETFLPYALGLLGSAFFLAHAIGNLPTSQHELRLAFTTYIPLIVGIVATPYAAGRWLNYLHTIFGSALFSLQLILSGWLTLRLHYIWWAVMLTTVEVVAGIFSAAYLNPTHGFLMQAQLLFQLAFGALLILSLHKLSGSKMPAMPETSPAAHHSARV